MTGPGGDDLDAELSARLAEVRSTHDVVPFMGGLEAVALVAWQLLPPPMERVLASSPDYGAPAPGVGPVWLQISADDQAAELVIYRARADDRLYVLAPLG